MLVKEPICGPEKAFTRALIVIHRIQASRFKTCWEASCRNNFTSIAKVWNFRIIFEQNESARRQKILHISIIPFYQCSREQHGTPRVPMLHHLIAHAGIAHEGINCINFMDASSWQSCSHFRHKTRTKTQKLENYCNNQVKPFWPCIWVNLEGLPAKTAFWSSQHNGVHNIVETCSSVNTRHLYLKPHTYYYISEFRESLEPFARL